MPNFILTPPNTPPFKPGQRVRYAGKILQVSNCERRVAANRVRWVVESLDGVHVFAELCELVPDDTAAPENVADPITRVLAILKEGEQIYLHLSRIVTSITDRKNERYAAAAVRVAHDIIKAEFATRAPAERRRVSVDDGDGTVTTIIEPSENPQPAPVRYACSKVAKVGDLVKFADITASKVHRVRAVLDSTHRLLLDNDKIISAHSVEFVPEASANLPETPDSSAVANPVCRGCGKQLNLDLHAWMWDCCPCNSPRGINHGLIPVTMCSCDECQAASKAKGQKPVYEAMTYAPPAEEISYGAREPDGTRTVIVRDAGQGDDWQPFDGAFKAGMEYLSRNGDCQVNVRHDIETEELPYRLTSTSDGARRWFSRDGVSAAPHRDYDITHQRPVRAPQPAPQDTRTVAELRAEVERLKERVARHIEGNEALNRQINEYERIAKSAEAERDAIRVQWQSLSDEREEERAALRRRGIRFVKVGGILEAIIPIDEPKAYTPTKPGELDRLLHEAHAESLTPATVNDAAKIEAFTHTEWKRGTKDGCGGELRPHLIELVRKSDYDALQGRCEALTKECDEWKAEAERCGQFELRQVEEREAIKRAVGFEENGPSLPEWCAKIARNLASEEAACSQLIDERDGAQDAADHLASNILGEPIDWSFHAEKWNEAREAALALRTQLAEANKRCDDLRAKLEQAESELNRLRNQLRIEYTRNDALARIRDAVGRIAQVFGDGIYVMPIDSELGSVQMALNRYKELEARTTAEISEADRVAGKTMIGGGELPSWTADVKETT